MITNVLIITRHNPQPIIDLYGKHNKECVYNVLDTMFDLSSKEHIELMSYYHVVIATLPINIQINILEKFKNIQLIVPKFIRKQVESSNFSSEGVNYEFVLDSLELIESIEIKSKTLCKK